MWDGVPPPWRRHGTGRTSTGSHGLPWEGTAHGTRREPAESHGSLRFVLHGSSSGASRSSGRSPQLHVFQEEMHSTIARFRALARKPSLLRSRRDGKYIIRSIIFHITRTGSARVPEPARQVKPVFGRRRPGPATARPRGPMGSRPPGTDRPPAADPSTLGHRPYRDQENSLFLQPLSDERGAITDRSAARCF